MNFVRFRVENLKMFVAALVSMGLLAAFSAGCHQSCHKSVQTYEYNDAPPRTHRAAQPVEEEEAEGEWQMVAPGEMVVEPD